MSDPLRSFLQELHRRKVFSSAVAYIVIAWLLLQVADVLLPIYDIPEWVLRLFSTGLFMAFPVVVLLAWFFDFSLDGVARTLEPESAQGIRPGGSATGGLPEGPSIAVLPFRSLDPDGGLFAEALGNDIITGLTQSSHLFVLSPGATLDYANPTESGGLAGADLGVRYLLRGSVRKSGDTLRVSAHLLDSSSGVELWSQQYDRELSAEQLFAVQDDIRERIVATLSDLHGVIYSVHGKHSAHRPTRELNAYECLAVALAYDKYLSAENHLRARDSLERAVKLDPRYDEAWAHLSWIYTDEWVWGFNPLPRSRERAMEAARKGIQLAPDNYHNHWLMSRVHYFTGSLELFRAEARRALELNDRDGTTLGLIGMYTAWSGDWETGMEMMDRARQLNPHFPDYYHVVAGSYEYHREDFKAALGELQKANLEGFPLLQIFLASTYARLDRETDSARHRAALRELAGLDSVKSVQGYLEISFPFQPEFVRTIARGISWSN